MEWIKRAWRAGEAHGFFTSELFRRKHNGMPHTLAAGAALAHPVSRMWAGYWQRGRA